MTLSDWRTTVARFGDETDEADEEEEERDPRMDAPPRADPLGKTTTERETTKKATSNERPEICAARPTAGEERFRLAERLRRPAFKSNGKT